MSKVYELCDCTDDERYFTLGIFKTFIAAVNIIALADKNKHSVGESGDNDVESLEIRERQFGLTFDTGVKVYTCDREWNYHEDEDENYWETVKTWKEDGEDR